MDCDPGSEDAVRCGYMVSKMVMVDEPRTIQVPRVVSESVEISDSETGSRKVIATPPPKQHPAFSTISIVSD